MADLAPNSTNLRKILFPSSSLSRFLMLPSIASLMALLTSIFEIGLVPTLQKALIWYDWLVGQFLNPFGTLVDYFASLLNWNISLQPHWKHVFVLFNIYMLRSVQNSYRQHRPSGIFKGLLGLIIGLFVGVTTGMLDLQRDNLELNFVFALIPVFGLFAYGSLNGIWQAIVRYDVERSRRSHITSHFQAFSGHLVAAARRTLFAIIVIVAALFIPFPPFVTSPGLTMVLVLVILHALYNLWDGVDQVKREPQHVSYLNTPSAMIGIDMLRYLIYCAILLALGAFGGPPT